MSESILVEDNLTREWNPTAKQKQFISVPFGVKEALYGGSAGSGKSEVLLLLPLIYKFYEHPFFKGLIMRRTFPELEAEIIKRSKEWYPSSGGTYNESKREWNWRSGASIKFGHADREEDVRKYDSAQYNYFAPDETTSFTQFQYSFIAFSRVRSRTADLPAIIRCATNPGNIGHAFIRDRFVEPCREGGKIIKDKRTGLLRIFIQATIRDNPHLLAANPEYVQQLESLPEAERRAKLLGDWYTFTGQVFNEFRLEPLAEEPENARHVIEPFDIPAWWPRVVGIDWGHAAMTWIGWGAIAPTGQVILYREYAHKEKLTTQWIDDFLELSRGEEDQIEAIRICHSASQNRGEPLNIIKQLAKACNENEYKATVGLGSKGRINKKLNLHEFLRWSPRQNLVRLYSDPYDSNKADAIFRNFGTKAYNEYLSMFADPEPEGNLPKLQIFNTCKEVIKAIPNCIYEDSATNGKNSEDVKEFDGDDPYDGICIMLDAVKDYMVDHAKELKEKQEENEALVKLATSQDQTAYYRKMEQLEKHSSTSYGVRRSRFRRRR